jgi:hypothetical protein
MLGAVVGPAQGRCRLLTCAHCSRSGWVRLTSATVPDSCDSDCRGCGWELTCNKDILMP